MVLLLSAESSKHLKNSSCHSLFGKYGFNPLFDVNLAGKMKNIAFIKDPDSYWIEIFDLKTIGTTTINSA